MAAGVAFSAVLATGSEGFAIGLTELGTVIVHSTLAVSMPPNSNIFRQFIASPAGQVAAVVLAQPAGTLDPVADPSVAEAVAEAVVIGALVADNGKNPEFAAAVVKQRDESSIGLTNSVADLPDLERDGEKWKPVFLNIHATTKNRDQDDVSIEQHPDLVVDLIDSAQSRENPLKEPGLRRVMAQPSGRKGHASGTATLPDALLPGLTNNVTSQPVPTAAAFVLTKVSSTDAAALPDVPLQAERVAAAALASENTDISMQNATVAAVSVALAATAQSVVPASAGQEPRHVAKAAEFEVPPAWPPAVVAQPIARAQSVLGQAGKGDDSVPVRDDASALGQIGAAFWKKPGPAVSVNVRPTVLQPRPETAPEPREQAVTPSARLAVRGVADVTQRTAMTGQGSALQALSDRNQPAFSSRKPRDSIVTTDPDFVGTLANAGETAPPTQGYSKIRLPGPTRPDLRPTTPPSADVPRTPSAIAEPARPNGPFPATPLALEPMAQRQPDANFDQSAKNDAKTVFAARMGPVTTPPITDFWKFDRLLLDGLFIPPRVPLPLATPFQHQTPAHAALPPHGTPATPPSRPATGSTPAIPLPVQALPSQPKTTANDAPREPVRANTLSTPTIPVTLPGSLPQPPLIQHAEPVGPMFSTGPAPGAHGSRGLPKGLATTLIRAASRPDEAQVELTLDPVELGKLRFSMAQTGDQMQVTLSAQRPETLDLLRRHAEDLRQEFRDAGFAGSAFTFSQWRQQGTHQDHAPEAGASSPDPSPLPEILPPAPGSTGPGLDLRL